MTYTCIVLISCLFVFFSDEPDTFSMNITATAKSVKSGFIKCCIKTKKM